MHLILINKSDKPQEQAKQGANFIATNAILCCIFNWGEGHRKKYGGGGGGGDFFFFGGGDSIN